MSRLSRSAFLSLAPKGQVEWMELDFDGRIPDYLTEIFTNSGDGSNPGTAQVGSLI